MNTIAYPLFAPTNNTEIVAADVRAELAKNNIRVSHLPARIGNSREYWRRPRSTRRCRCGRCRKA